MKVLKNNWWLKLTALAFSILLWVTITNTTDPQGTYQITDIPIQFLNEDSIYDAGMTYYVDGGAMTTVEVNVRKSELKNISASDFKATADLSQRYGETGYVAINIEVVNNKKLLEGNYKQLAYSIYIRTEKIVSKKLTIESEINGKAADGYKYGTVSIEPKTVTVSAPESKLETISRAVVDVKLNGNNSDFETSGDIKLYDVNNREMDLSSESHITLSEGKAKVKVSILKQNTIPVVVEVSGEDQVAEGYRYISYECDISEVSVSGSETAVASVSRLVINGDITDIAGADDDVKVIVDLNSFLPDGVKVEGDKTTANITFKVEKLDKKEFSINYSDILLAGTRSDLQYSIVGDGMVLVTARGLNNDLDGLNASQIKLSVNVAGLEAGEYTVPLSIGRISGFDIWGQETITVKITDANNSENHTHENQATHAPETSTAHTEVPETSEAGHEQSTDAASGEY